MTRLPLWFLVLASLAGYIVIAVVFPLSPDLHRPPLPDIFDFTASLGAGLAYCALIALLFLFYWLAYRQARERAISLPVILVVAAVLAMPLILTYPYNATDVYRYWLRARLLVVHGQNPFTVAPSAFPADPFVPLAGEWVTSTSPYGPLWELVAAGLAMIRPQNLQLSLILFKTFAAALHMSIGGLLWVGLGAHVSPAERTSRVLLWAWNPALLLISAANAHNDALMLFWLVLAWSILRRRPLGGLLVSALAVLTKPSALLLLPFFYMDALRRLPDRRSRLRLFLPATSGTLVLALLAFLPFAILSGQPGSSVSELVQRLLFEAGEGGGFSPISLLLLLVRHFGGSMSARWLIGPAAVLFGIFYSLLFWLTAQGRSLLRSAADCLTCYLFQAFKFRIWYASWPLPWLLLDTDGPRGRLTAGIWFLLTAQLSVFVYSHLWHLVFDFEHVWTHLIGVPFTFLLPPLAALVQRRYSRHD